VIKNLNVIQLGYYGIQFFYSKTNTQCIHGILYNSSFSVNINQELLKSLEFEIFVKVVIVFFATVISEIFNMCNFLL
jgi:hypothetical protein